ncbi:hypothetical protein NQ176_g7311 [Zarea fungicola]|uniref:Uncharacterized protein n=1 Tax=Zarea fungicola TaxID=93591 RepID=A0ACC1MYT8_9HYPO|nr:hypothetical protein NQ176_g7311 [Lecanicillium fungicola]
MESLHSYYSRHFVASLNPELYALFGSSSLNWAARNGRIDTARRARSYNLDVNYTDHNGVTPLLIAVSLGFSFIADFLLQCPGIDVNCRGPSDSTNFNGGSPLTLAVEMQMQSIVEPLISLGADINAKDGRGRTPLWHAASNGACDMANILLQCLTIEVDCRDVSVDVNARDNDGRTALWWAARNNHFDTIRLLLAVDGVKRNLGDKFGLTPLSAAVRSQSRDAVSALLTG